MSNTLKSPCRQQCKKLLIWILRPVWIIYPQSLALQWLQSWIYHDTKAWRHLQAIRLYILFMGGHNIMLTFPKTCPFLLLLGMPLTAWLQIITCGYSNVAHSMQLKSSVLNSRSAISFLFKTLYTAPRIHLIKAQCLTAKKEATHIFVLFVLQLKHAQSRGY